MKCNFLSHCSLIQIAKKHFLLLCLIVLGGNVLGQSVPGQISFQGKLTEDGQVVTGTRAITFSIPGSGWSETHDAVSITNGLYAVMLGSVTPIPADVFTTSGTASLHIVVGTNALSPDITIGTVPYAFMAEKAALAEEADLATTAVTAQNATAIGGTAMSNASPSSNNYLRYNGLNWAPAQGEWQLSAPNHMANLNAGNVYIGDITGNGKLTVNSVSQAAISARSTGTTGVSGEMVYNSDGTGIGYGNAAAGLTGYAFYGRKYHFGVAGYRNDYGEGHSAGVFGAVSNSSNPLSWGALGYEDTLLNRWGGYFHGNIFTDGRIKIAGGSPGNGKILTSDADGLGSWQTAPVSSQWVSNEQTLYYYNAAGTGYVGIGTDNPTAALHLRSADVYNNFHTFEVENTSTSGAASNLYGIYAKINSTSADGNNAAIVAYAAGTTGNASALRAITAAENGTAVYALSNSGSANSKAIMAVAGSDDAYAGYFLNGKSYFSGKVGIGTTTPDETLVVGDALHGSFTVPAISVGDADGGAFELVSENLRLTSQVVPFFNSAFITASDADGSGQGNLIFNLDRMGIGTSPGTSKLHVYSSEDESSVYIQGSGSGLANAALRTSNTHGQGVAASFEAGGSQPAVVIENSSTGGLLKGIGAGDLQSFVISNNGTMSIYNGEGTETIRLDPTEYNANEGSQISLWNAAGEATVLLDADESGAGAVHSDLAFIGLAEHQEDGTILIKNGNNVTTVKIDPSESTPEEGSQIALWNGAGEATILLDADEAGAGVIHADAANVGAAEFQQDGTIIIRNGSNIPTIKIDPSEAAPGEGGQISLWNASGTASILIDGDYNNSGSGRITTNELEITGGADIAEPFPVVEDVMIEPGTVLSIDPQETGSLKIADKAYDHCVAGIVSGAENVKPGLVLKHSGTIADGNHLIALTGRVYCKADARTKPIKPGDLLTTSDLPGYAMKATDRERAQGAVIGKAMTSLDSGTGMVLVLVSLQ